MIATLDTYIEAISRAQRQRIQTPLVVSLRRAMQRAFRIQRTLYLRELRKQRYQFSEALSQSDADALFDRIQRDTHDLMAKPIRLHIGQAMEQGINQQQMDALGLKPLDLKRAVKRRTFAPENPRVLQYMESHGGQLVTGINDTTRSALRKVLAQGVEEGWSYPKTAKAIRDTFTGFAGEMPQAHIRDRAELIAQTEIADATEYGMMLSAQEMQGTGLTMEHKWSTSGSPCPVCAPNPGVGWIPLDTAFPSGHTRAPGHPACRCATSSRIKPGTRRAV